MRPRTILCVIDMQQEFEYSAAVARPHVRKAIKHARREGWRIINVNYRWPGNKTMDARPLAYLRMLLTSPDIIQVDKCQDDGGWELHEAMVQARLHPQRVIFCGVNATACVANTVAAFARLRPDVECIISDAVSDYGEYRSQSDRHEVAVAKIRRANVSAADMFRKRGV